jgi:hypothetical protein
MEREFKKWSSTLIPISCAFGQVQGLAQINKIQNIFLEAGAAITDGSFEELGADSRV